MKHTLHTSLLAAALLGLTASDHAFAGADSFANATEITGTYANGTELSLLTFTAEAGEPGHRPAGAVAAQKSAWWKWTAPSNGFCTVDTLSSYDNEYIFDTVLSVYTGSTVNALTRVVVNDDNYAHPHYIAGNRSTATFYAQEGTTYQIAVDGYNASSISATSHKTRLRLRQLRSMGETYFGMFASSEAEISHGTVLLTKTSGHAFSGKMVIAGKSLPFKGVFGPDGLATVAFERKSPPGSPPLPPINLLLDGATGGNFAIVTGESWASGKLFNPKRFGVAQSNGMLGKHTAVINRSGANWTGGSLSFTTSAKGVVTGAATLPDGTKLTIGSWLAERNANSCSIPIYSSLFNNMGYLSCALLLTEAGLVDSVSLSPDQNGKYSRPANPASSFMPAGMIWSSNMTVTGSTYTAPSANNRALDFLNATTGMGKLSIPLATGELDPAIMEGLTLDIWNKFVFASKTRKPVLNLNKSTGIATGYILDDTGKKRRLTGVLFMDGMTPRLQGHVSGTTRNVFFEVIP